MLICFRGTLQSHHADIETLAVVKLRPCFPRSAQYIPMHTAEQLG